MILLGEHHVLKNDSQKHVKDLSYGKQEEPIRHFKGVIRYGLLPFECRTGEEEFAVV